MQLDDLLEAQANGVTPPPTSPLYFNHNLVNILDKKALPDNEAGQLAAHQVRQFRQQLVPKFMMTIAAFALTVFLGLTAWNANDVSHSLLALCLLLAICTWISLPWLKGIYSLLKDLRDIKILSMDGIVTKSQKVNAVVPSQGRGKRKPSYYMNYFILMNGTQFQVTSDIYLLCEDQMRYRVFYTSFGHEVVNLHSL